MRFSTIVGAAAALMGTAVAQDLPVDSVSVDDAKTGFKWTEFWVSQRGVSYRVAVPSNATDQSNYEAVVQIIAPINIGWAGFAWGGSMTYNPLTITWVDGTNVMISSRMAFGYYSPPAYAEATYRTLKKATGVINATHYQATAACVGCTKWGDEDSGYQWTDPTAVVPLAFAYSNKKVANPKSLTTSFSIHDLIGHWYADLKQGANAALAATITKNL